MGIRQRLLITRLAALVALAGSAALLLAYLRPNALVCGFESNCEEVLSSRFGTILAVPLPVLGVAIFAALFELSLSTTARSARLLRYLALAAAVGGLALILLQVFVLQRFCPYCLLVDFSAVATAYAAFGRRSEAPLPVPIGRALSVDGGRVPDAGIGSGAGHGRQLAASATEAAASRGNRCSLGAG